MWCPNAGKFVGNCDTHFLLCRWQELFGPYTPENYHPKLLSLPTLVSEALKVSEYFSDSPARLGKNLACIQEEIRERLASSEGKLCSPWHLSLVTKLSRPDCKHTETRDLAKVLIHDNFAQNIEDETRLTLQRLLHSTGKFPKKRVDTHLRLLGTFALQKGYSSSVVENIDNHFDKNPQEALEHIFSTIPNGNEIYPCVIAIEHSSEMRPAIRAVCDDINAETLPNMEGLPRGGQYLFLFSRISGLHVGDALANFKAIIQTRLNLVALFYHKADYRLLEEGWLYDGVRISPINHAFHAIRKEQQSHKAKHEATNSLSSLKDDDPHRFSLLSALDLHAQALVAKDHRVRLVNLWSALECLSSVVGNNERISIIDRVQRLVLPILTLRKVDKLVRYLAISIRSWLVENPSVGKGPLPFPRANNGSVPAERILTLLTKKNGSPEIAALLHVVGGHPLLVYRVYRAWELFNDGKILHSNLTRSLQELRWHLSRIYRARNLIVHRGIEVDLLPQLADNLENYVSWTLTRLLHGIRLHKHTNVQTAWHFWEHKSAYTLNALQNQQDILTVGDIFPSQSVKAPYYPAWES